MKITIEYYGKTYTMQWSNDDVPLLHVLHSICLMLFSLGWSQESIIEAFSSDDGDINNPFEWDVS